MNTLENNKTCVGVKCCDLTLFTAAVVGGGFNFVIEPVFLYQSAIVLIGRDLHTSVELVYLFFLLSAVNERHTLRLLIV